VNATPRDESGWTIETYSAHNEALRAAQEKLDEERDRRYRELQAVREKAAAEALVLARTAQASRDERDNRLREQISEERGRYVTRSDLAAFQERYELAHKPLADYISQAQGRERGIGTSTGVLYSVLVLAVAIITAIILYVDHHSHQPTPPATTVTVTVPSK
jgi:Flp pilus assembly protein TadB